jgi:DNA-binding HxlR family transcriptional regulator
VRRLLPRPCTRKRSGCPVANTLDIVGDRWTLLVVRDMLFFRKVRYSELLAASPESIPTNILADRLRVLEKSGIVRRRLYQRRPDRYEYLLTPRGIDLAGMLLEMIRWGNRHVFRGTWRRPPDFEDRPIERIASKALGTGSRRRRPA